MRILVAAPVYPPDISGVSQVAFHLAANLAQCGHEVHVATRSESGASASETVAGVQIHRFALRGSLMTRVTGAAGPYLEFLKSRPWDALSVHCAQTWSTDLLMTADGIDPNRVVLTLHGITSMHDRRHSRYTEALASFARRVSAVVGLSDRFEEAEFCRRYNLPGLVVIPNGVDLGEWSVSPMDMRDQSGIGENPWVVNVSNHSIQKDHATLHRVVRTVRERIPALKADIIGRPLRAQRHRLHYLPIYGGCWYRCLWSSATGSSVSLRRNISRQKTVSMVQEADLTLLTSSWEASPLVILESMAAGTPWLSFDVGCVRGYVGGHAVRSEAEMVDAAAYLLAHRDEARNMGLAGRLAVQSNDWHVIAEAYEKLLERARDRAVDTATPSI